MRIAICDDEKAFRGILIEQLTDYANEYLYDFIFYEFRDGKELLNSKLAFDLIFMDYQMKEISGIDAVSELRKRNDNTTVIFVSSFSEIVYDSIKYNTFRFLVKPLDNRKLLEALSSFTDKYNNEKFITAEDDIKNKICRVPEASIIYLEADNLYCRIRTFGDYLLYRGTISACEKLLQSDFFYRVNRSYIVNMNYIADYSQTEIRLENGEKALLTKGKYKDFQKAFFAFCRRSTMGDKI